LCIVLTACTFPGGTRPLVKLGLVAPFEGQHRAIGYDALYAVKLAIREQNAAGGMGEYLVELVALDDDNDSQQAARRAEEMAIDPDVLAVIGGFTEATAAASGVAYSRLGLAFVPVAVLNPEPFTRDFVTRYTTLSGGIQPTPQAYTVYVTTRRVLAAYDRALRTGKPSRAAVLKAMAD